MFQQPYARMCHAGKASREYGQKAPLPSSTGLPRRARLARRPWPAAALPFSATAEDDWVSYGAGATDPEFMRKLDPFQWTSQKWKIQLRSTSGARRWVQNLVQNFVAQNAVGQLLSGLMDETSLGGFYYVVPLGCYVVNLVSTFSEHKCSDEAVEHFFVSNCFFFRQLAVFFGLYCYPMFCSDFKPYQEDIMDLIENTEDGSPITPARIDEQDTPLLQFQTLE